MATSISSQSNAQSSAYPQGKLQNGTHTGHFPKAALTYSALVSMMVLGGLVVPAPQTLAQSPEVKTASTSRVRWTPKPDRGSAQGTLSGGRRGSDTIACGPNVDDTSLHLLVPQEHESLVTSKSQPTLAWQVKTQAPVEMELLVSDVSQAMPLFRQRLSASSTKVVTVDLPESAALSPGNQYRWTVVAQCPAGQKTEIYARSFIRQISGESLEEKQISTTATEPDSLAQAVDYANSGIWYDAVAQLLELPDQVLEGQPIGLLADLLEQAQTSTP